jgi:hypothetical protein
MMRSECGLTVLKIRELNMNRQAESTFSLRPEYEESSYQHGVEIFSEL